MRLRTIASGLDRPVQVAFAGDRLLIAEQAGRIRGAGGGVFLDLTDRVSCCDNGGLLSFTFHPRYAENGQLFVLYVDRNGDTAVARYRRRPDDPSVADPESGEVLLVVPQPKDNLPNHHGGALQFGPDGFLYISIGDGGATLEVTRRAQELGHLLGKVLRIDVVSATPYRVPPDNPFTATPGARAEIWALGLRNPWRFTFDAQTGDLILGDVGQHAWEELNVVPHAQSRGANFGWPVMEGTHCFPSGTSCSSAGLTLPVVEYPTSHGCSVTAGFRYRGAQLPRARGAYLFGDWCSGEIRMASRQDGVWTATLLHDSSLAVVSIDEGADGEAYVVDYFGGVHMLVAATQRRRAARH